jgi:magnesium chelatase family protein
VGEGGQAMLGAARERLSLSTGEVRRVLSVARTCAALAGRDSIGPAEVAEAVQCRARFAGLRA